MATFNDLVTSVCSRLNKNVNDTTVATRIKRFINETAQEQWDSFPWSFRLREYLLPEVTDLFSTTNGTVTATNGSQTVTFASAILPDTTTYVGAYIRFYDDAPNMFYRVVACTSTSAMTIEPAYKGTSASGKNFELKKMDWLFPSELYDVSHVLVPIYTSALPIYWNVEPPNVNRGIPTAAYIFNSNFSATTYSTGTVTGTINSNVLTGSGTAWLANVTPGDTITITGDSSTVGAVSGVLTPYTVHKVTSDTSITLYQNLLVAPAGATYTSTRQFGRNIRLDPSPNQGWGVLVAGWRKYPILINSNDVNEMTYRYPTAIIEGAIYREEGASPDMREGSQYQIQKAAWDSAKAEDRSITKHQVGTPLWSNRGPSFRI